MSESSTEYNPDYEPALYREFSPTDVEEIKQVIHKYDGDFSAEEIDAGLAGEPIETITIVNGEVVEHLINGVEGGD